MEVVLPALVLAVLVAAVVLRPLLAGQGGGAEGSDERRDLEAAKESKYREIRDAELDFQMGKLSEDDWRGLDAELRAQAIEILRRLDKLGE